VVVTRCFTQHRKYCCWMVTKNASGLVQTKSYCWTNAHWPFYNERGKITS